MKRIHEMADLPVSYAEDVAFLRGFVDVVELRHPTSDARVAVVPAWQGRIVTSSLGDVEAPGFGWLNRDFIARGEVDEKINAYGGEDRFWLGPEGGQFSIFHPPGTEFDLHTWRTPAGIDTDDYEVVAASANRIRLAHRAQFENWSGTVFDVAIERELRFGSVGFGVGSVREDPANTDVRSVAFESLNRITNVGERAWKKADGLLSIWTIGMFRHSPATTVVIPYVGNGDEDVLGPVVNDAYFGKVPADRLQIADGSIFFKADGRYRSKIGVSPQRTTGTLGSWDADGAVLTLVSFDRPEGLAAQRDYTNQMWEYQAEPYRGDAVHSYNDGAWQAGGMPLGPFYELETSSPAAAIAPGESLSHTHRTVHLAGPRDRLDGIAIAALGVGLNRVARSFPGVENM